MRVRNVNKKKVLVAGFFILVVALGLSKLAYKLPNSSSEKNANNAASTVYKNTKACELFTLEDAKKVIGDDAKQSQPKEEQASTTLVSISACAYSSDTVANQSATGRSTNITLRSPLDSKGAEANAALAKSINKTPAKVDGYDEAYWISSSSQLLVIKNSKLVFIDTRTITVPLSKTKPSADTKYVAKAGSLEDAKKIADLIKDRF